MESHGWCQGRIKASAGPGVVPNAGPLQTYNNTKIVHSHQLRAPKTAGPGAAAPLALPACGTGWSRSRHRMSAPIRSVWYRSTLVHGLMMFYYHFATLAYSADRGSDGRIPLCLGSWGCHSGRHYSQAQYYAAVFYSGTLGGRRLSPKLGNSPQLQKYV